MKQFNTLCMGDTVWITSADFSDIVPTYVIGIEVATRLGAQHNITVEGGGLIPRQLKFSNVDCTKSIACDRKFSLYMFRNVEDAQTQRAEQKDIMADKIQRKIVNLCKELKKLDKNKVSIRMRIQQVFQMLDLDK